MKPKERMQSSKRSQEVGRREASLLDPTVAGFYETVRRMLNDGDANRVVAVAAVVERIRDDINDEQRRDLCAGLEAGFSRMIPEGRSDDPGCFAKVALLNALKNLDCGDAAVFVVGTRLRQLETVWSPDGPVEEETASGVRSVSALALPVCQMDAEEMLRALMPLLFDDFPQVRQSAIEALGLISSWEANLLVETKVCAGDPESFVVGAGFVELLRFNAPKFVPLVAEYLRCNDGRRFEAVCALSECKDELGVTRLIEQFGVEDRDDAQEELLLAFGRTRHSVGTELLLERLANGGIRTAQRCIIAIARGPHAESLANEVRRLVTQRSQPALADVFERMWASGRPDSV